MKINEEAKRETKKNIIVAASELFVANGFQKTTMKKIAKVAGIGDATIYNYFKTKEDIIIGYFEWQTEQTIEEVWSIDDLDEYNIQEKLQVLLDIFLERLSKDEDFVSFCVQLTFKSPMFLLRDRDPIKKNLQSFIEGFLMAAEDSGEIEKLPFKSGVSFLICEFYFSVVLYWIKDDSDEKSNTTQMSDLALALITQILKSGVLNKGTELITFFIKSHLFSMMDNPGSFTNGLKTFGSLLGKIRKDKD